MIKRELEDTIVLRIPIHVERTFQNSHTSPTRLFAVTYLYFYRATGVTLEISYLLVFCHF